MTDGVRSAVEQAAAVAGQDGLVGVGGPNVIQQCLREGLLDEVRVNLVPAFLGDGIRYFDGIGPGTADLENPTVIEGDRVTHLIYRVRRAGTADGHRYPGDSAVSRFPSAAGR